MAHAVYRVVAQLGALLALSSINAVYAQRTTVLFVNGRTMPATSLQNATVYNSTREALITTQASADKML